MKKILERTIAKFLKEVGFETTSKLALEIIMAVFEDRIIAMLNPISSRGVLTSRPTATVLDVLDYIENLNAFTYRMPIAQLSPAQTVQANQILKFKRQELFNLIQFPKDPNEEDVYEEPKEWTSPLSTRVEKFIHIYDFMPAFPPIHTFRLTLIKPLTTRNLSSKVKNRLEQSLKSEGNMIKLIKSSASLPEFINYLYKNKK